MFVCMRISSDPRTIYKLRFGFVKMLSWTSGENVFSETKDRLGVVLVLKDHVRCLTLISKTVKAIVHPTSVP